MDVTKTSAVFAVVAGLGASAAAEAADLPVAPEPVNYVRVCNAYGDAFYYIPGTDTCLSIYGRVRIEYRGFNYDRGFRMATGAAAHARDFDTSQFRARGYLYTDSRTGTEFGLLRTYTEIYVTDDSPGGSVLTLEHGFVQFGGLTAGRGQSFYDFANYPTYASIFTPQLSDQKTNFGAYTFAFGNGLSSTVSLESSDTRRSSIAGYGPDYGGTKYPDLVANMRVDQGWGSAQLMGALHQVWPGYNALGATPDGTLGFAVGAGVQINAPFGRNTVFNLTGTYAQGATQYASNDTTGYYVPSTGAVVSTFDATYDPATGELENAVTWSVSGGFITDITPEFQFALQAGYSSIEDQLNSDYGFSNIDVQGNLTWAPPSMPGFYLGLGLEYRNVDPDAPGAESGDAYVGYFRAQRQFN
ncbi:porin [Amorphus sp. 3PC139-8]|uniref:porin n=1 Tax=Amorphus sp. 3PC139-8 TaxID=2735676 RepID=UPI00345D7C25